MLYRFHATHAYTLYFNLKNCIQQLTNQPGTPDHDIFVEFVSGAVSNSGSKSFVVTDRNRLAATSPSLPLPQNKHNLVILMMKVIDFYFLASASQNLLPYATV